jgi:hypothetical protein
MNQKLNPTTIISGTNGKTILDYWSWAYSDIMGNTERGVFAEYLIATALGIDNTPRQNWYKRRSKSVPPGGAKTYHPLTI